MNLLNKLFVLLLLAGFYAPVIAATADVDFTACSVFSDEAEGDKKEGEEEPDCE